MVVERINGGGMSGQSPIPTIIVRGCVGPVGSVGGPESRRRASTFIRGVNTSVDAVRALGGMFEWLYWPSNGQRQWQR